MDFKLYTVKSKDDQKYYTFALEDIYDPKEHLQRYDVRYIKPDLRTLKEIPFPKGRFETSDLEFSHFIFYDGELYVHWDDEAVSNYPEDLTWDRDIGGLISSVEKLVRTEIMGDGVPPAKHEEYRKAIEKAQEILKTTRIIGGKYE